MRKPYPSDLSDQQWAIIEPLIPVHTAGRPRINDMREVLNAIFYLNRSGCQGQRALQAILVRCNACALSDFTL